jgi:hypothetical protein
MPCRVVAESHVGVANRGGNYLRRQPVRSDTLCGWRQCRPRLAPHQRRQAARRQNTAGEVEWAARTYEEVAKRRSVGSVYTKTQLSFHGLSGA